MLRHRLGFSRETGLIDLHVPRKENATIGTDMVSLFEEEDVPWHELSRGENANHPLPADTDLRRTQMLEIGDCPFCLPLLEEAEECIEEEDGSDGDRINEVRESHSPSLLPEGEEEGEDQGDEEDGNEDALELSEEEQKERMPSLGNLIEAELLLSPLHLRERKTLQGCLELREDLLTRPLSVHGRLCYLTFPLRGGREEEPESKGSDEEAGIPHTDVGCGSSKHEDNVEKVEDDDTENHALERSSRDEEEESEEDLENSNDL
jgi:hypothetical protein